MLYPKIRDIEKSNKLIKIIFIISIAISLICMLINYLVSRKLGWSIIVIASIITILVPVSTILNILVKICTLGLYNK